MEREETAIVVAILTLALLSAILIVLFIVFQRRKNSLLLEQKDAEKRFVDKFVGLSFTKQVSPCF